MKVRMDWFIASGIQLDVGDKYCLLFRLAVFNNQGYQGGFPRFSEHFNKIGSINRQSLGFDFLTINIAWQDPRSPQVFHFSSEHFSLFGIESNFVHNYLYQETRENKSLARVVL